MKYKVGDLLFYEKEMAFFTVLKAKDNMYNLQYNFTPHELDYMVLYTQSDLTKYKKLPETCKLLFT